MNRRARHAAEYALVRALAAPLRRLPYRAALALADVAAGAAHGLMRARVREARARMTAALGPDAAPADVARNVRGSVRNLAFAVVDLIRASRMDQAWIQAHVDDWQLTLDTLAAHRRTGRGLVLASPHMGAWDVAGIMLRVLGLPVFTIAAHQRNPYTDAYIARLRRDNAIPTLLRGSNLLRQVLHRLRAGEILAILPDVRVRTDGIPTRFLGGTANIGPGMALFAKMAQVPIAPGFMTREGPTRHRMQIGEFVHPDPALSRDEDVRRMSQAVLTRFDRAIRERPDQWFWFNRRWVLDPLHTAPHAEDSTPTHA